MMKKQLYAAIFALLLVASLMPAIPVNAAQNPIRVAFGSADWEKTDFSKNIIVPDRNSLTYVNFPDVQPVIIDGRLFVPIRPVVEADSFGGSVTWDETTSTATVVSFWGLDWDDDDQPHDVLTELVMRPGYASVSRKYTRTGKVEFVATPEILPQIVDGRFMVPLRTLEYALYSGDLLVWDEQTKTACILGVAG